jgi:hypothetical protein
MNTNLSLEHRIAEALTDKNISSLDVATLLAETKEASITADNDAKIIKAMALDPLEVPNPVKARSMVENAEFMCARLRTLIPRLQTKYDKVHRAERYAKWCSEYDRVKIKRDAAAEKLRRLYPEMAAQLVALLTDIEDVDCEVRLVETAQMPFLSDGYPYDAKHPPLKSVELTARGLDHWGNYDLKIMTDLQVPNWNEPKKLSFPVPRPAVDWSGVVPKFPSKGADWASKREQGAA